jgi:signal transduction histidine kinase
VNAPLSTDDAEFLARLERAKLDALKELAYGASHEINNPLANISARAQALLRDEADPERRRALEAIHQQALRAHEMISDLMLFARPPRLEPGRVDLASLVAEIVGELAPECGRRGVAIAGDVADDLPPLAADPVQLAVAVRALAVNAVEAIGRDGRVDLVAVRVDAAADEPSRVRIDVRDDGPGVAPEVRPHIFDPFFSGREAGRGLGFGLSKAWRIVEEHGGRLTVEAVDRGALFRIELPVAPTER